MATRARGSSRRRCGSSIPNVKPFVYDPEKARQLLAEAGWKPGKDGILEKDGQRFAFTLITNNGNEIRRDIATLVQDDLKKLGIEVKIELYEWAVFLKNFINKGNFDAMVLGLGAGARLRPIPDLALLAKQPGTTQRRQIQQSQS